MYLLCTLVMLVSHAFAARGFFSRIFLGRMPRTVDCGVMSILCFYDCGYVIELLGVPYQNDYIPSLFEASTPTFAAVVLILTLVPWVILAGSFFTGGRTTLPQEPITRLKPSRHSLFYGALPVLLTPFVIVGAWPVVINGDAVWSARATFSSDWGCLLIIFYFPMHVLAFYVRQQDSRSKSGRLIALLLMFAAIFSTLSTGQRTYFLLPILFFCLFCFRIRWFHFLVVGTILILIAGVLVPLFKSQYSERNLASAETATMMLYSDIARVGMLGAAIDASEPIGTRILPYPMSGYVYSALLFVPRSLAPYKGRPTAVHMTAHLDHTIPADTDWQLGMGAIEEASVNLGTLMIFPILFLYGMLFGWFDQVSLQSPSLVVATRLGALWVCAHNLASLLPLFGVMGMVDHMLDRILVEFVQDGNERDLAHHRGGNDSRS